MNYQLRCWVGAGIVGAMFLSAPESRAVEKLARAGGGPESRTLRLSTKNVSESSRKIVPTSMRWEGRDYDVDAGIDLLMGIIRASTSSSGKRALALDRAGMLGLGLKGREDLDEILDLYSTVGTRDEKAAILSCAFKSEDPRGLPLLYRVLDTEKDPILRLLASRGLAQWNIRRGVSELIELIPSNVALGDRKLGGEAAGMFHILNHAKGWGCPDEEIRKSAQQIGGDNWERYLESLVRGFRDWFGENELRFPEWKPGDPLPKDSEDDKDD